MATTTKMSSAKETILRAVEVLENENDELRNINNKIMTEMDSLRRENELLRQELNMNRNDNQFMKNKMESLEDDNTQLQREYQIQTSNYEEERKICNELHTKLKEEHVKFTKQIENLKNEIIRKESSARKAEREVDGLRTKLDRAGRKNYSDRDIELLHEVEMLKNEKKDIESEKVSFEKENKKMKHEIKNLQTSLEEKDSELRNENRRHSLLTKEFNSLLDENNRLKLQMRRRNNVQSLRSPSNDSFMEGGGSSTLPNSSRTETPREPSLIINNEVFQPATHDYPLTARERTSLRRPGGGSTREPTLVKRSGTFGSLSNLKDSGKRILPSRQTLSRGLESSDATVDSLPSLTSKTPTSSQSGSQGKMTATTWNV